MLSSPAAAEDDSTAAQIELEEEEAPITEEDTAHPPLMGSRGSGG